MVLTIGDLPESRVGDAYRAFATALQFAPPSPGRLEGRRPVWYADRAVVALDGDRIVGHAGDFPFGTLLPGGAIVPTAGLTRVGVLPTHRRRGLLTGMMERHLRRARDRGDVLGSLRAAESAIYGRFGYGLAGLSAAVRVHAHRSAFAVPVDLPGSFELLQGPSFIAAARQAYERCRLRPGTLTRDEEFWNASYEAHLVDAPSIADWAVIHRDTKGRPDGFARWTPIDRDHWDVKGHKVELEDLHGATFEIEAGLWRFVLDLDLVDIVVSASRPIDEPIRHRFVDARAWETTEVWDEQWVRVLDVVAVLGARSYAGDGSVVLDVVGDSILPDNVGRYEVGAAGCRRVRRAAEIRLGIAELGAVVLGGTSFGELAAAGRLQEIKRGSLARADQLFHSPVAPWCGTNF